MFASKNKNGCFDCDNCPKNADPSRGRFCVAWWDMQWTNEDTGQVKTEGGCGFRLMPRFLTDVCTSVKGTQAATESARNEIAKGLAGVAYSIDPNRYVEMVNRPERLTKPEED